MTPKGAPAARVGADAVPTSVRGAEATSLEAGLGFRLGRAHRVVRAAWEARIADLQLSGPQASVLRAVAEQPGVGLRELARRLHTDPMNAKRLTDGLEQAGLMGSVDDPADRRRRALGPTETGLALSRAVAARSVEWGGILEGILGPDDLARLGRILERLERGIAALPDAASGGSDEPAHG